VISQEEHKSRELKIPRTSVRDVLAPSRSRVMHVRSARTGSSACLRINRHVRAHVRLDKHTRSLDQINQEEHSRENPSADYA